MPSVEIARPVEPLSRSAQPLDRDLRRVVRPSRRPRGAADRSPGRWLRDPDVRHGMATMAPMLLGYAPFAVLIGVAIGASGSPAAAMTGNWLVFAGTAHLTVVQLVGAGAGVLAAAVPAVLVNLRLLLFSATIAQHWRGTSLWSRLLAAATIIDPTWAVATRHPAAEDPARVRRSYAGASALLLVGWTSLVALGALLGPVVPAGAGLALLAPLCLVALAVPNARARTGLVAVLVAGAVTVLVDLRTEGFGLLAGTVAGTLAALAVRRRPEASS